ncbi:hypothetical protein HYFRA_00013766 [Hymenoscyphus fraxineus]|uniref:Uncharacterized protein n=1 Tax=Hymenoscyphus fraxineus TaxID=746836 RepID=A0A9N9LBQ7_9HELO|nr:hypothetical protein HYFRA_00013766 [Hymenoscyphus fraxineus]
MIRTCSDRKWKQVLGFDDGSYAGPAQYSDMPEVVTEPVMATISSYPRLPRDITFYKRKDDIVLSPSPPAPSPNDIKPLPSPPHLFYISLQDESSPYGYTRQPEILLHNGPSKSSPVLSYVEFQDSSMKSNITMSPCDTNSSSTYRTISFPSSPSSSNSSSSNLPKPRIERLSPTGGMFSTEKYTFSYTNPRSFVRERFEWRYSSGPFIRTSEGRKESGGLKLIRMRNGETIAVYAGLAGTMKTYGNSKRVLGMFRFLNGKVMGGLGEEFEVLAVMSILAIVERSRSGLASQKREFGIRS